MEMDGLALCVLVLLGGAGFWFGWCFGGGKVENRIVAGLLFLSAGLFLAGLVLGGMGYAVMDYRDPHDVQGVEIVFF